MRRAESDLNQWPERRRAVKLHAAAEPHLCAHPSGAPRQLVQRVRLANARLADKQYAAATARERVGEAGIELGQHALASQERCIVMGEGVGLFCRGCCVRGARGTRKLFRRVVGGHHELVAVPANGADATLAAVFKHCACAHDGSLDGCATDRFVGPQRGHQLVIRHRAMTLPDKQEQQPQHLGLHVHPLAVAPELKQPLIELELAKSEHYGQTDPPPL
ncbi:MAG: hypothetical protein RL701_3710 [Pseudomonadota bacterium]|jgi:hypothetical protein